MIGFPDEVQGFFYRHGMMPILTFPGHSALKKKNKPILSVIYLCFHYAKQILANLELNSQWKEQHGCDQQHH